MISHFKDYSLHLMCKFKTDFLGILNALNANDLYLLRNLQKPIDSIVSLN